MVVGERRVRGISVIVRIDRAVGRRRNAVVSAGRYPGDGGYEARLSLDELMMSGFVLAMEAIGWGERSTACMAKCGMRDGGCG